MRRLRRVLFDAGILGMLIWCGAVRGSQSQPVPPVTVAVLNFANRNPGDGWDWLEKGLADMLITDLSKAVSLTVVQRDDMASALAEVGLAEAGLVEESTAGKAGRVCEADWVCFGSFLKEGTELTIEAHVVDVGTEQLLRVESVKGNAETLFGMEKELAYRVINRLGKPLSAEERKAISEFPTDSITALEHYSRSLDHFDRGEWFDALLQCRLALDDDPGFVKPAARLADLYREVGEPKHALAAYRRLTEADAENALPELIYLRMGRLLEDAFRDDGAATVIYRRILARHPEYDRAFDIREPLQPSKGWDDVGGVSQVRAMEAAHDVGLRALERLAEISEKAGDWFAAAKRYSQIVQFMSIHAMSGATSRSAGFRERVWSRYTPLYWRCVRENKDSSLYPCVDVHVLPGEGGAVSSDTLPTGGFVPVWLAPPGKEIAELTISADCNTIERTWEADFVQVEWSAVGIDVADVLGGINQFKVGTGKQMARFKPQPGIRAVKTHVFATPNWQVGFILRPHTPGGAAWRWPGFGRCQVTFLPDHAEAIFLDGKQINSADNPPTVEFWLGLVAAGEHTVELRWPDGSSGAKAFLVEEGRAARVFVSAEQAILSRQVFLASGSHTFIFADRRGKLWVLWDQAVSSDLGQGLSQESDILCATSEDALTWSGPVRMPVSSAELDMKPMLQQDRRGVYWLIWSSSRDPEDPKWLWIASSRDGFTWSFPRKVVLPIADKDDVARWHEANGPYDLGFTMDQADTFWLVWQGRLFRSQDGSKWTEIELLKTHPDNPLCDNWYVGLDYFLSHEAANTLLLLASRIVEVPLSAEDMARLVRENPSYASIKTRGEKRIALWRREAGGGWRDLGFLAEESMNTGSVAVAPTGSKIVAFSTGPGIFLRTYDGAHGWSQELSVGTHIHDPFHPSVACLADGRCAVAYASKEGIVVVLVDASSIHSGGHQ